MVQQDYGYGQATPQDSGSEFNAIAFIVRQITARMDTMKLVKVQAVNGSGGVGAAPTVDVLPLVQMVDGNGNATPIAVVHGVPCQRLQGGNCAIIVDPKVGDIGYVVVSDRDISNAKAKPGEVVTPGSFRKFDLADGIYVGGILNAAPTVYVWLKSDGFLKIADAHGNVLETSATGFSFTGDVKVTGKLEATQMGTIDANLSVTGNITATGVVVAGQGGPDQVALQTHVHTSGSAGNPTTPPTPGT